MTPEEQEEVEAYVRRRVEEFHAFVEMRDRLREEALRAWRAREDLSPWGVAVINWPRLP